MTDPAIDVVIAAPLTAYVAPFKRAAAIGVTALLVVAGLSILSPWGWRRE